MKTTKLAMNTLIAGAVLAAGAAAATDDAHAMNKDKEKCYGVVKAGKNDCGDADGNHSCAGYATVDGSGKEWVALPKGVCEKLVGGSLEPYEK